MQSGSPSARSLDRSANRFPEIVGVLIALLTLTLPVSVIAHYSQRSEPLQLVAPLFQEAHR